MLTQSDMLQKLNNVSYDMLLRLLPIDVSDDVIVVAIDDASIDKLGPWPWPRNVHARFLDSLSRFNPRAIGFDVFFSEPDKSNTEYDTDFGNAIRRNGRVILPIYAEQLRLGGQLRERFPIPEIGRYAQNFGHIHIEIDEDGVSREVFLRAGLGQPIWQSLPLAVLSSRAITLPIDTPNTDSSRSTDADTKARIWVQSQPIRIPFAGPPGSFKQVSYVDVLEGRIEPDQIKNAFLLVGITASGEGDRFPTPFTQDSQLMPGVEIFANVISGLINKFIIRDASTLLNQFAAVLPILAFMLLFQRLMPLPTLVLAISVIGSCFLMSYLILAFWGTWNSPIPGALIICAAYPIVSWLRLEETVRYLREEIDSASLIREDVYHKHSPSIEVSLDFLKILFSLHSWDIIDRNSAIANGLSQDSSNDEIQKIDRHVPYARQSVSIELTGNRAVRLNLNKDKFFSDRELKLAKKILRQEDLAHLTNSPKGTEVVQRQIHKLRDLSQELQSLRKVNENSLADMADGVVVLGEQGNVILINKRARELTGKSANEDVVNLHAFNLFNCMELLDSTNWETVLRDAYLHQNNISVTARIEQSQHVLIQITYVGDIDTSPNHVVVTLSDISELREAEKKRGEMLSFLSHDLRSPLVSVLALIEVAERDSVNANGENHLKRIKNYTKSALNLSEQFVELIRAEIVQPDSIIELDLAEIATNAVEHIWTRAHQKQIKLKQMGEMDGCYIHIDPDLIERALVNLLDNAVKYSESGTEVTLMINSNDKGYTCTVSDHGCGIPQEALPKLFDIYHRVSNASRDNVKGSGLGLAFVKAVASRHNGAIFVKSELGVGTEFELFLPRN
ncbi:MAG: CHASE2 domain-containing protein [Pseudomonadota bacterium]